MHRLFCRSHPLREVRRRVQLLRLRRFGPGADAQAGGNGSGAADGTGVEHGVLILAFSGRPSRDLDARSTGLSLGFAVDPLLDPSPRRRVLARPRRPRIPPGNPELVLGPGGRHVEQPNPFGQLELRFDLLVLVPGPRLGDHLPLVRAKLLYDRHRAPGHPVVAACDSHVGRPIALAEGRSQEDDVLLEALRLVQVHDANRVAAARHQSDHCVGPLQGRLHRLDGTRQRRVAVQRLRTHSIQQVDQSPGPHLPQQTGRGQRKDAGLRGQPLHRHVRRLPPSLLPPAVQLVQCIEDGGRAGDHGRRNVVPQARRPVHLQPTPSLPICDDLGQRNPEERSHQRSQHMHLVGRIGHALQEQQERRKLVLEIHARPRHLHGQVPLLQHACVECQVPPHPREDQEVGWLAFADRNLLGDMGGDETGVVLRHFCRVRSGNWVCPKHARTTASGWTPLDPQGREGGLRGRVLGWKHLFRIEDALHDVLDARQRAEVGFQSQHLPKLGEATLDGLVQGNVGAPEAVDALLRVAHHEQGAGPGPSAGPVVALARRFAGQQEEDFGLQRVSVLKLVHQ